MKGFGRTEMYVGGGKRVCVCVCVCVCVGGGGESIKEYGFFTSRSNPQEKIN